MFCKIYMQNMPWRRVRKLGGSLRLYRNCQGLSFVIIIVFWKFMSFILLSMIVLFLLCFQFAHRDCIQRWCNEKGNTICEICLQVKICSVKSRTWSLITGFFRILSILLTVFIILFLFSSIKILDFFFYLGCCLWVFFAAMKESWSFFLKLFLSGKKLINSVFF